MEEKSSRLMRGILDHLRYKIYSEILKGKKNFKGSPTINIRTLVKEMVVEELKGIKC